MDIIGLLKNAFGIILNWMGGYNSKESTKARVENDKTARKDKFNEAIKNHDLDAQRRGLS